MLVNNNNYRGNNNLKSEDCIDYITAEEYNHRISEIVKCRNDILYFAEHYYTIVSVDRGKEIIKLYSKQRELLKCLEQNNRVVCLASRQSGKSTSYCIYALWLTLFNPDKKILIVANKEATALEIVSRIRLAYELIPNWLKCGIKVWNKGQIIFGNDSSIEGISTSADSARGKSCSVLIIDECVSGDTSITIRNKHTKEVKNIPIETIFNMKKELQEQEVLTRDGWSSFTGIKKTFTKILYKLTFSDNSILKCTSNHKLLCIDNNFKYCKNIIINDKLLDKNNKEISVRNIEIIYGENEVYDLLNVEKNSCYITNNVNSHNCGFIPMNILSEFWQSVYPIVSSGKNSKVIMVSTPNGVGNLFYETYEGARLGIDKEGWVHFRIDWWDVPGRDEKWKEKQIASFNGDMIKFSQEFGNAFFGSSYTLLKSEIIQNFKNFVLSSEWFQPSIKPIENTIYTYNQWFIPEKNKTYLIGADIADGVGSDKSIILVFDISNGKNIIQVASFGDNTISTIEFSYVLIKMATLYNNAHIVVEANGIGRSVLDMLESVYDYENIVNYGGIKESGIFSHVQVKANACMWVRNITSVINIRIYEKYLIAEMEYFEKKLGKFNIYQAVSTKHDDYMMAFIWGLFCLKEEIIDNYYNVESFETTKLNINIPVIIKSYTSEYFNNINDYNERYTKVDRDIDNIYKNLIGNKSAMDSVKNDRVEQEDVDIVYDDNDMNKSDNFNPTWY